MLFKKKTNGQELPTEHAEQILFDVFDSCGFEKNTVPLEALLSYANYRKEKYTLQKSAIIIILVLFMLLPLLFVTAELVVAVRFDKDNTNPEYTLKLKYTAPFIPVDNITVRMNGRTVPVYEVNAHEFIIRPTDSGEMSISVTLFNQQTSTDVIPVVDVDGTPPALVSVETIGNTVKVKVRDEGSGLNIDSIIATDEEGTIIPWVYDESSETIDITYPSSVVTLTVPDMRGNVLTLLLNPETGTP